MNVSVVILTKNSADKLSDCLKSVKDTGEIIILDGGSTDKTVEIAKKFGAKIYKQKNGSYDTWRNQAKEITKSDWLFYIDPDERVTPELKSEIEKIVNPKSRSVNNFSAYAIPRRNFVFGKELKHGGWYPDYVLRLMRKDKLINWSGELHEQPEINGEVGKLENPFIHLKEEEMSDMVTKTNRYSVVEAKLLFASNHPPMVWWRFIRPVVTEVFDRLILKLGFLDGVEGIIFSVYQGYSRFATYAKLWEMQQGKKL